MNRFTIQRLASSKNVDKREKQLFDYIYIYRYYIYISLFPIQLSFLRWVCCGAPFSCELPRCRARFRALCVALRRVGRPLPLAGLGVSGCFNVRENHSSRLGAVHDFDFVALFGGAPQLPSPLRDLLF